MTLYPLNEDALISLKSAIIEALKGVYDPEIPVNIYDLGLIYHIFIDPQGLVKIEMTLTSPGCPVAQTFPGIVENVINNVTDVNETQVELVWDPPWTSENMSEAAKLQLGML
ncbi:FeS assembly SUF system protein [Candidatus Rickettsiella isopodorum]|jgi:FeS assembly SUF system protein|uniref:FeS assembly SUF system protein n=1 Tax=Candidatus Rickettsiella isopodorum TaxID=1225476 RepID=A0A1J8P7Z6_9COXI|nr:SUF system Fe-S cluster assembly protein [Candidatus Rickettsiella isopodorum]OIZ95123.1 FeS assembly SUF system protein [Candidatus Rickettsiella isopodorum]